MMHREYQTIERAAEAFDRAVEDQKKRERVSGSGGTGGAGGAGGKGGGQAGVTGPAPTPVPVPESEEKEQVFKDLAGYEWAERDISTLAEAGIVNGCGEGVFAPAEPITRAEFTKIFVSAFGICAGDADLQFEDVRQGDWFYESVKSAYAAGYMKGVDSRRFAPDAMITREDMAVALCRYLNVAGGSLVDFADADAISDYAKDAVVSLAEAGMINGYEDHTFRPQAGASRAETAVLFARILKEKGEL